MFWRSTRIIMSLLCCLLFCFSENVKFRQWHLNMTCFGKGFRKFVYKHKRMYRHYSAESPSSTWEWDTFTPVQCFRPFVTTARWAHSLLFNTQSSSSPSHACRCTFLRVPRLTPLCSHWKKARSSQGLSYVCGQQKTPLWQTQNCPGCLSDSEARKNSRLSFRFKKHGRNSNVFSSQSNYFFKSQVTYKFNSTYFTDLYLKQNPTSLLRASQVALV